MAQLLSVALSAVLQVYDVALAAALLAQNCGPRNLAVTKEWKWLNDDFAGKAESMHAER